MCNKNDCSFSSSVKNGQKRIKKHRKAYHQLRRTRRRNLISFANLNGLSQRL